MIDDGRMPEQHPEGTYRDSRWREQHHMGTLPSPIICEETGLGAKNGVCPVHGGDACLYCASLVITYWRQRP